jgi:Mg2+/Co2+ transporter CorB
LIVFGEIRANIKGEPCSDAELKEAEMKKASKKIAMILIVVILVNCLTGCVAMAIQAGTYLLVGAAVAAGVCLVILFFKLIKDASQNSKDPLVVQAESPPFTKAIDSLPAEEIVSMENSVNSLPEAELNSFKEKLYSLSETELASVAESLDSFSEKELAVLIKDFNSLPQSEIVSSIEELNSLSGTKWVNILQQIEIDASQSKEFGNYRLRY